MFFNYLFTGTTIYNYGSSQTEILINSTANGFKVYKGYSQSEVLINSTANGFKVSIGGIEAEVLIDAQIRLIYTSWRKIKDNEPNWQIIDK